MKINRKALVVISSMTGLVAFSGISASTDYYSKNTSVSSSACQLVAAKDTANSGLYFTPRGVINRHKSKTQKIMCPVLPGGEESFESYEYDFYVVTFGDKNDTSGVTSCTLIEIKDSDAKIKQELKRGKTLRGTKPKQLKWGGVRKKTASGYSAFAMRCSLPPGAGLANISSRKISTSR